MIHREIRKLTFFFLAFIGLIKEIYSKLRILKDIGLNSLIIVELLVI